jgi:predicted nucleic acid-binding protein
MTPSFVLDASVAAKLLVPESGEPLADRADDLYLRYTRGDLRFIVPDLFWAEILNVLWKTVRLGRWPQAAAMLALAQVQQWDFPTLRHQDVLHDALAIALSYDRTAYDSIYLAIARMTNSPLLTADERLANAVAAHLPVRWLGSI